MTDEPTRERRAFALAVAVATVAGVALRVWHLAIPLRYDEAVTLVEYASAGFVHAATEYPTPNNHILNTLLIHGLTSVFGSDPFVIRLPAFVAGCALVPATAWMAARRFDRRVAVVAALLVAAAPVLVEYSVNARGYAVVALLTVVAVAVGSRLLERPLRPRRALWATLGLVGVAGLYTVPVMLLPWAAVSAWLWVNLFVEPEPDPRDEPAEEGDGEGDAAPTDRVGPFDGLGRRLRREVPLIVTNAVVAAAVALLYWPVVRHNGWDALVANRFVAPLSWAGFFGALPGSAAGVASHWSRGVPGILPLVLASAAPAALLARGGERGRFPLGSSVLFAAVVVLLLKRNPGEARVWLWALPLVLTAAAAGTVALLDRWVRPRLAGPFASGFAAACFALVSVHLVLNQPLWDSLETGGFMEVEDVAAWLAGQAGPEDAFVTDFVSREPLEYYLRRKGVDPEPLASAPERDGWVWLVLNLNAEGRAVRAAGHAVRLGLPLDDARPVATFGGVQLFRFAYPPAPVEGAVDGRR